MSSRRLSAILAADAVGFSARTAADETGALRALRAALEVLETVIGLHGGRIVKTMGDGLLAEFGSVVNAVSAAAAIQARLAARNRDLPAEGRFDFRIGVHVGDVVAEGDDILGDGVNVAARLEAEADPGGVMISARAHDDVEGKTGLAFEDRGERVLKGVSRPVRVFALAGGAGPVAAVAAPSLPDKPSLAVLPFVNMSSESEQEYFADGLTEDIITAVASVPWLFVIARNSSFTYKGAAVDVRKVGRDLGVRYVLEGSVRKAGARLRVTGQLIDAETGAHLWAERMDGQLEDVFDLQDRITEAVVAAIAPQIQGAEIARAAAKRPESLSAYDHMLRAMAALNRAQVPQAGEQLDRALVLAPGYGKALAMKAWTHTLRASWAGEGDYETNARTGIALARRALEAAPGDLEVAAYSHYSLGFFCEDVDSAISQLRGTIERCPSLVWAWVAVALLEAQHGDPTRAFEACDRAQRLNPKDPMAFRLHSARVVAHWALEDWAGMLEPARQALATAPTLAYMLAAVIVSLAELGRDAEAGAATAALVERVPGFRIAHVLDLLSRMRNFHGSNIEVWRRRLREAGIPD